MKQSAMSPRTGRIIELDIAKGLGILSVILYNTLPASPLHTALGGYMMPLFFVVSGLVMQKDACSFSLRRFWEKNARLLFYYIQRHLSAVQRGDLYCRPRQLQGAGTGRHCRFGRVRI